MRYTTLPMIDEGTVVKLNSVRGQILDSVRAFQSLDSLHVILTFQNKTELKLLFHTKFQIDATLFDASAEDLRVLKHIRPKIAKD